MDDPRLLLVEDEPAIRTMLARSLRSAGYGVTCTSSAETALELLRTERFDLLITDLLLKQLDGIGLMCAARALDPHIETIIMTGAGTVELMAAALNHGAHSCLLKPVRLDDLERHAAAALRRRKEQLERNRLLWQFGTYLLRMAEPTGESYTALGESLSQLQVGLLLLDIGGRRVKVGTRSILVSSSEFDLLLYLARRTGQVVSAEELAREVLQCSSCTPVEARGLVKSHVHRLRVKIGVVPDASSLLVCVRGAGYMLTLSGA